MKKYAFLLMGDYDTSKDHCVFKTDNMESYIENSIVLQTIHAWMSNGIAFLLYQF